MNPSFADLVVQRLRNSSEQRRRKMLSQNAEGGMPGISPTAKRMHLNGILPKVTDLSIGTGN